MPTHQEHEKQAFHNLDFLEGVNRCLDNFFDWKVTVCFYTALHFINSHLRRKLSEIDFASHEMVNQYINPHGRIHNSRLDEDTYTSYRALQTLSRRSRYLRNDKNLTSSAFTAEKHFAKAVYHLDKILCFMNRGYRVDFKKITLNSPSLRRTKTVYFEAI